MKKVVAVLFVVILVLFFVGGDKSADTEKIHLISNQLVAR